MLSSYELTAVQEYLKAKKQFDVYKKQLEEKQEKLDKTFRGIKLPMRVLIDNDMVIIAKNKSAKCVQLHHLPIDGVYKDGSAVTVHSNFLKESKPSTRIPGFGY